RKNTSSGTVASSKSDPQLAAKLGALGYVASDAPVGAEGIVGGIDPKDRIDVANSLHQGMLDIEMGHFEEAVPKLERVIQSEGNSATAYQGLGDALISLKNYEKA